MNRLFTVLMELGREDGVAEDEPGSTVYQLRVVLRRISPLIWRRLVVPATSPLANLPQVLQVAFGWEDVHLHRFTIRGVDYGPMGIVSDTTEIGLARFGLRVGERFSYEYDAYAGWVHDLRVEAVMAGEAVKSYPRCIGGRRGGPREACGGPWAFMEAEQRRPSALVRAAQILGVLSMAIPMSACRTIATRSTSWPSCTPW